MYSHSAIYIVKLLVVAGFPHSIQIAFARARNSQETMHACNPSSFLSLSLITPPFTVHWLMQAERFLLQLLYIKSVQKQLLLWGSHRKCKKVSTEQKQEKSFLTNSTLEPQKSNGLIVELSTIRLITNCSYEWSIDLSNYLGMQSQNSLTTPAL